MSRGIAQLTLAILKPDVQRIAAHRQYVEQRMREADLSILCQGVFRMSRSQAESFYGDHKGKFYYDRLVNYMVCGPIGVYVLRGIDAIPRWRALLGPTKVYRAVVSEPDSLRGLLGLTDTRNGFHGSDSYATALREIQFFFPSLPITDSNLIRTTNSFNGSNKIDGIV
ncbi:hypothetical protein CRM22_009239 [Opisthorchis felineus]|uniref:Nucleoside diphosphate kinase-like domain-containing protein n=1 Tax=Opisthorchis felineus TaxID=147828 RepID=A0A4S2L8F1_OPIFE|nr:hypothetical protein CRM22_009239 [Opisthorchis felineus]